jgi:hypothetical protein
MRRECLDIDPFRAGLDDVPNDVLRYAVAPNGAVLSDRSKELADADGNAVCPRIDRSLGPDWNWNRPDAAGFAHKIDNRPVILAALDGLQF